MAQSAEELTHEILVQQAERWLRRVGCNITFHELVTNTSSGEIPDAIGWRDNARVCILVECKATRSDFLSDSRKRFRSRPECGMGDWRFYLCPPGVIEVEDLPPGWGLLYSAKRGIRQVHGTPELLDTSWGNPPLRSAKKEEVTMLASALRRLQIRGHLDLIYERLGPIERPAPTPQPPPVEAAPALSDESRHPFTL